ncbi:MAG: hypothetical protein GX638_09000 [Crenarchaeota archaeon]|jgi:hypothetical protein|nr:hypothetical protein [Thermoproteota archaeon]
MIEINKYYYASTPRSEKQNKQERVKILEILTDKVRCITVDPLKVFETYVLSIDKVRQNF